MWSQGDSRSGGSDNDLPPSLPVCECKREWERQREKLCVSAWTVNVYVCDCVFVYVRNDLDGQHVFQINESCNSTITGHYRNTRPNLSCLWVTMSESSLYTLHLNILIHLCTSKPLHFQNLTYKHLFLSSLYTHKYTPMPVSTLLHTSRRPLICRRLPMATISLLWWPIKR